MTPGARKKGACAGQRGATQELAPRRGDGAPGSLGGSCGAPHPTPPRPAPPPAAQLPTAPGWRRTACAVLFLPVGRGLGAGVCRGLDCGRGRAEEAAVRSKVAHSSRLEERPRACSRHPSGLCQTSRAVGPLFPTVLPGSFQGPGWFSLSSAAHETAVFVFNVTVARSWASSPPVLGSGSVGRICCFVDLS